MIKKNSQRLTTPRLRQLKRKQNKRKRKTINNSEQIKRK